MFITHPFTYFLMTWPYLNVVFEDACLVGIEDVYGLQPASKEPIPNETREVVFVSWTSLNNISTSLGTTTGIKSSQWAKLGQMLGSRCKFLSNPRVSATLASHTSVYLDKGCDTR